MKDKSMVQDLCGVIGMDVDVMEYTQSAKRLCSIDEDSSSPRPCLVGFETSDAWRAVLDKSSTHSVMDVPWFSIKILPNQKEKW